MESYRDIAEGIAAARHEGGSWIELSVDWYIRTGAKLPEPSFLRREDGQHVIYRGVPVSLIGPSEAAKSWVAAIVCNQAMYGEYDHVLYVDFEATLPVLIARLRSLGVFDETMLYHLHYMRPDEPMFGDKMAEARRYVKAFREQVKPAIVILDGVTEGMAMHGLDANNGVDVAKWQGLCRDLFGLGTIEIDHTGKNMKLGAVGSIHKRAGIWQQVTFQVKKKFGYGKTGRIVLKDTKDRPGALGPIAPDGVLGELVLEANEDGTRVSWKLELPEERAEAQVLDEAALQAKIVELILNGIDTTRALKETIGGAANAIQAAINHLRDTGTIARDEGPAGRWSVV